MFLSSEARRASLSFFLLSRSAESCTSIWNGLSPPVTAVCTVVQGKISNRGRGVQEEDQDAQRGSKSTNSQPPRIVFTQFRRSLIWSVCLAWSSTPVSKQLFLGVRIRRQVNTEAWEGPESGKNLSSGWPIITAQSWACLRLMWLWCSGWFPTCVL